MTGSTNHKTVPANAPIKSKKSPNFGTPAATNPQKMTTKVLVSRNLATGKFHILGRLL